MDNYIVLKHTGRTGVEQLCVVEILVSPRGGCLQNPGNVHVMVGSSLIYDTLPSLSQRCDLNHQVVQTVLMSTIVFRH